MVNKHDIVAIQEAKLDDIDFVHVNGYKIYMSNEELINDSNLPLQVLNDLKIPIKRNSLDKTVNSYGNNLLELCAANDLFILN